MRFNGRIEASFDQKTDAACWNVNKKPQYIKLNIEICGYEKIRVAETSPLSYTFQMGLDKGDVISQDELQKMFVVSGSRTCGLREKIQIVASDDGKDYPLSPNLR